MGWLRRHPELVVLAAFVVVVVVGVVRYQTRTASAPNIGDVPASASSAAAGPPPAAASSAQATPAQRLADLDGDTWPAADYQAALDALGPKCTQDQVFVAGLGDTGYRDLVKNGVTDETRLSVLRHLADSIPASLGRTDCTSMLSGYLVLREG